MSAVSRLLISGGTVFTGGEGGRVIADGAVLIEDDRITAVGTAVEHVHFEGSNEGDADDDNGNNLDEVDTELVSLDLHGYSRSRGAVSIGLRGDRQSLGQIEEQQQLVS